MNDYFLEHQRIILDQRARAHLTEPKGLFRAGLIVLQGLLVGWVARLYLSITLLDLIFLISMAINISISLVPGAR